MLAGNEAQQPKPKPVRRRHGRGQPAPELDTRVAEMRLRQSSTTEETELAEKHLQLLRSVELVGPPKTVWLTVTTYLVLTMGCASSRFASAVGIDTLIGTTLAKDALAVVVLYHVVCAAYSIQLATQVGHKKLMIPWFFQTLYLGWPSLSYLLERKRRIKESYTA